MEASPGLLKLVKDGVCCNVITRGRGILLLAMQVGDRLGDIKRKTVEGFAQGRGKQAMQLGLA